MSDVIFRGNSPIFSADLRHLGAVFFPGETVRVAVPSPGEEGCAVPLSRSAPAEGEGWLVDVEALPTGDGTCWTVRVAVRGPSGARRAEEELTTPAGSPRQFEHGLRNLAKGLLVDLLSELRSFRPGWGFLTGVRPTKLVHQMLDRGEPDPAARLQREYRFTPEKARLITEVALRQRPFLNQDPRAVSIYVGIPFCPTICSFCSFSIYPILEHKNDLPDYLQALGRQMEIIGDGIREMGLRVQSIYFGGGTPTSPKDQDFAWMLQKCADTLLKGQSPAEYTIEGGRPETFNRYKLDVMAAHGVTRVSVNPQTTVQATLMHLGRIHTTEKFYRAYDLVRSHPHPFIINSDIIIGLPGEGPDEVQYTLRDMARLTPENLTVHTLAIKRGSRLHQQEEAARSALKALTPGEAEALVREAEATARSMGQQPYYLYRQKFMVGSLENVGYSLPGRESIYNIQMMEERQTVLGLGSGATSKWYKDLGGYRGWLLKAPEHPDDPVAYAARAEEIAMKNVAALRLLYDPSHNPAGLLI